MNAIKFKTKCMQLFCKYNDEEHWTRFQREMHALQQNENEKKQIMPLPLQQLCAQIMESQSAQTQNAKSRIYDYSYYLSMILLFSFWKCILDEIDEHAMAATTTTTTSMRHKSVAPQLCNKEWISSRIKHSMLCVGLRHLPQTQLFKLLK
mmetsp:Transcript_34062/g.54605  ORF Transcript_34062/g.54605 Transcript_34062/m.54605 type:complete len:150 (+) Transcript_34062:2-451(+)